MTDTSSPQSADNGFGANEWLVEEMYERFKEDRSQVDPAWWDFFDSREKGATAVASPGDKPSSGLGHNPPTTSIPVVRDDSPPVPQAMPRNAAQSPSSARQSPAVEPKPVLGASPLDAETPATAPIQRVRVDTTALHTDAPKPPPASAPSEPEETRKDETTTLRGPAARVVKNMEISLDVPTATSVRSVPAKLLIDNRIVINNHLRRARGGKVSFTHLIGYAMVEALREMPEMNVYYDEIDGKPSVVSPAHIGVGIAIDLAKDDGTRQLLVPAVKVADKKDFRQFWNAYEEVIHRARNNKLTIDDFAGTTISLTNPGTIGTVHSVPRLMKGQGAIIGVGAMQYPAEYEGSSQNTLSRLAVSKVMTLTSTYDHRVIQGAQSGDFLRIIHKKLLGEDGFYDRIFQSLRIPYEPIRWVQDISVSHDDQINKTARVVELIHAYRVRGHLMANTDPLEYSQRHHEDLDVTSHGLTLWDLDREFPTGGFGGKPVMQLREILGVLRDSYCRSIGLEYMHIQDAEQREWIQQRIEHPMEHPDREEQLRVLRRLNSAEAFETFLQTKYVGQKRFSLEGGESVIPLLDAILNEAARPEHDIDEVCIGMPHRGRLNVLANIAGKSYRQIFAEFDGSAAPNSVQGSGDVKYHLGTEGTYTNEDGDSTLVYLAANPSHLEAVNPVLEGIVRAKQDRINRGGEAFPVLPVLLHGDAAFAGQGVVAETLNLSQLRGYRTGGTVHVVINNQVGFTTAPTSSRSTVYCTDAARMIQAPIFHVNGDDPEACVRVARLAFEFRQKFDKDVVIDMVCYRRRGHNEGDDPSMTQPLMYDLIEAKRSVRNLYTESLIGRGDITMEEADAALRDYQEQLERAFAEARTAAQDENESGGLEKPLAQQDDDAVTQVEDTAVSSGVLKRIGDSHMTMPENFTVHPKLQKLLEKRQQMSTKGGIDWGYGEILAFGSLLVEGVPVRLAGQDSRRGTFVQRHAVMIDHTSAEEWTPLMYLSKDQEKFLVYDSLLSEFAAMGFEYGYSVERPEALVCWEAQFGDFVNGAQTIVDEFISSSEQKWDQRSSVTLLLPHGYEGQGPDHSSARIERFLQLCAQNNMTVAQPSTPASHFHLLRRQAYKRPRRPLVVFTPKSMLRNKMAVSSVEDFTQGSFQTVIGENQLEQDHFDSVERVLLCSGKVYWDLLAKRKELSDNRTAIVRMEQLYPLDVPGVRQAIGQFPNARLTWVQDEPENQGPWPFMGMTLVPHLDRKVSVVARPASASPASGSAKKHSVQQKELVERAFQR